MRKSGCWRAWAGEGVREINGSLWDPFVPLSCSSLTGYSHPSNCACAVLAIESPPASVVTLPHWRRMQERYALQPPACCLFTGRCHFARASVAKDRRPGASGPADSCYLMTEERGSAGVAGGSAMRISSKDHGRQTDMYLCISALRWIRCESKDCVAGNCHVWAYSGGGLGGRGGRWKIPNL